MLFLGKCKRVRVPFSLSSPISGNAKLTLHCLFLGFDIRAPVNVDGVEVERFFRRLCHDVAPGITVHYVIVRKPYIYTSHLCVLHVRNMSVVFRTFAERD